MTYKTRIQKDLYETVAKAAAKAGKESTTSTVKSPGFNTTEGYPVAKSGSKYGKDAITAIESPGFKNAGSYTEEDVDKYGPNVKKFLKQ